MLSRIPEESVRDALAPLVPFVQIAVALGVAGGISPAFFTLPRTLRSYVQHFAAGLLNTARTSAVFFLGFLVLMAFTLGVDA